MRDTRICAIGDSFVAGIGDPQHRGWLGRVAARSAARGLPVTSYNLGVRRDTSGDVRSRWHAEAARRLPPDCDGRVVLSFGVNDTTADGGGTRVAPDASVENLSAVLTQARSGGWPALVIGPAPIADREQNLRTRELDAAFAATCRGHGVPYIAVFDHLDADEAWRREVEAGDGAHPGAAGYDLLAELVFDGWWAWLQ